MIKLYTLLFELGPSAQGLGSYDERFGVPTPLDRAEENGLLDLQDRLSDSEEDSEYSGQISTKQ